MKTVLCFGDSNTWGYVPGADGERFAPDARWPGVLQRELPESIRVIEEALCGRTTVWDDPFEGDRNGKRHLPVVLDSQKPLHLVILMLGTNDLKHHLGLDAHDVARGAGVLVDLIRNSDAGPGGTAPEILLVAPPRVTEGKCPFGHLLDGAAEKSTLFSRAFAEVATEKVVPFFDAAPVAVCPVPDCIHLDAEGHRNLGRALAKPVAAILNG